MKSPFAVTILMLLLVLLTGVAMASEVKEYRLDNGLLVLLKENHNAPVISFNVVYRVGSKYERPGITGISHLIEHMMFKSTKTRPLGEFDRLLTLAGADNNAYTWLDETVYYELIDKDKIEVAMELEADRMRNLSFLPDEHAYEMTVVRNELEQRDDSPQVLLFENLVSYAFRVHPYSWPTIGWREDVEGVKTQELKEYYDRFYHPDNAFIVAVGDFGSEQMFEKIRKFFGDIPKGGVEIPRIPKEPTQLGQRRFLLKKAGNTDYVLLGFHIPEGEHPDSYPVSALAQILGGGKTSRLYKAVVETGMASYVFASANPFGYADPFLFLVGAGVNNSVKPESVEETIFKEIENLKEHGVTEEELARAKKQAKVSFVYDKDSVNSEAQTIIAFELASTYRDIEKFLPALDAVTVEDVKRVANHYLKEDNSTVGYFIGIRTEGNGMNSQPYPIPTSEDGDAQPSPGRMNPSDALPSPLFPILSSEPVPYQTENVDSIFITTYENGLRLIVKESHNNQTVAVSGHILAGAILDPVGKRGLARLTADTLTRGTKRLSSVQIAKLLEDNGMELAFNAGRETVGIVGRSLSEDALKLLRLLIEVLREPSFPKDEVEKARLIILNEIRRSEDDTFDKAFVTGRNVLYGEDEPYGGRISGTAQTLSSVSREEVLSHHKSYYLPSLTTLIVVGDVNVDELTEFVGRAISGWKGGKDVADLAGVFDASLDTKTPAENRIDILMPDKSNVSVVFMKPGLRRTDPDFYSVFVANYVFGGDFLSRLNERLRVKEGLTYGSFSFVQPGMGAGPWAISVQVNPENTEKAVSIVKEEWQRFWIEGITEEELFKAKSYLTGNFAVKLDTISAIASLLNDVSYYDLGYDYISRYKQIIQSLTLESINEAVKSRFAPENWVLVTAGTFPDS